MKKVIIQNFDGRSFGATFSDDLEMQSWIDSQVAINSWGLPQRESSSDEGLPERVISTREVSEERFGETVISTVYTIMSDYNIQIEDITLAHNLAQLRAKRDVILASYDKYLLADFPVSAEELVNIKLYRQYLRDVTSAEVLPESPLSYAEFLAQ